MLFVCLQVAAKALETAVFGAYYNVMINLKDVTDEGFKLAVSSSTSFLTDVCLNQVDSVTFCSSVLVLWFRLRRKCRRCCRRRRAAPLPSSPPPRREAESRVAVIYIKNSFNIKLNQQLTSCHFNLWATGSFTGWVSLTVFHLDVWL